MTADLREVYHDKHLGLVPAQGFLPSMLGPDHAPSPAELAEERDLAARTKFGIPPRGP